ncbi:hypothetical protein PFICI_06654 [Pestalotiopsis fici W106-1]|uniref:Xylanolytic transcriptional activator regulatory domain-containing protein n=1 Tax=Pestalotiopsis fici (strain W106-1 / CGMCC3.15140) TaxID=1229662 RepID=W3X8B5_PESFW|nr:uncharacterized protein PFICI_06654 [Pestalotiopsis fici W106-1]ETS81652.1 hypothetical protein PFICI_06654 [Pestalotiopsis fici W106-1]
MCAVSPQSYARGMCRPKNGRHTLRHNRPEKVPSLSELLLAESSVKPGSVFGSTEQSTTTADVLTPESLEDQESADLLPMREILPIIDAYFREFNCVMPLFHQASFMKLLHEFCSSTSRRSKVSWGIINCVLALGSKVMAIEAEPLQCGFSKATIQKYEANAQRCLDEFMMREEDTLGIQGLLAVVILHQANSNSKPAFMLTNTAIRQAHRLQMYTRESHANLSPEEAKHRDNDLSFRNKTPSIQLDIDLDIDLPREDGGGVLQSVDGLMKFNYFRSRVQLAHLEGKIYDNLYSIRSKKLSREDRSRHVDQISVLLDKWQQSIPVSLQDEHMIHCLPRVAAVHMKILHHHYLLCLVSLHGLYSIHSGWMKAIGVYGQTVLANMDNNTDICMRHMQPALPSAWTKCCAASRRSIRLLVSEPRQTCSLWLNMGAYYSGIIILLANCQYYPSHEMANEDHELAKDGIKLLKHFAHIKVNDQLLKAMSILDDLEIIASKAVEHYGGLPEASQPTPISAQETYSITHDIFGNGLFENLAVDIDDHEAAINPIWEDDGLEFSYSMTV